MAPSRRTIALLALALIAWAGLVTGSFAREGGKAVKAVRFVPPHAFVNAEVERVLDVSHPAIARETVSVEASNVGEAAAKEYYVAVDAELDAAKLAWLEVYEGKGKKRTDLKVEKAVLDGHNNVQLYKVTFSKPVPASQSVRFTVHAVYTGLTSSLPKTVPQNEQGSGVHEGNLHWNSPYVTRSEKVVLKTTSSKIHSKSPSGSVSGSRITYGPFKDVAPHSHAAVRVHAELSHVPLRAKSLKRIITLSHWTGIASVAEHWDLHHDGAPLSQPFSRTELLMQGRFSSPPTMIRHLRFNLPAGATNVFFRDLDGNVSTSHFQPTLGMLELQPRYPMFGGWKFYFWYGYDAPLSSSVTVGSGARHTWKGPVFRGLENVPVDKLEVEVVLPEGATNVQLKLPYDVEARTTGREKSYLDSVGREKFGFVKGRVVDEMWRDFEVSYDFPATAYLRKPLVMFSAVLAAFLASMAIVRLDFSITKDAKGDTDAALRTVAMRVEEAHGTLESLLERLQASFEDFKHNHHDVAKFESSRADLLAQIKSASTQLAATARPTDLGLPASSPALAKLSKMVAQLSALWAERVGKVGQIHDAVVELHKSGGGGGVDEKRRQAVGDRIRKLGHRESS